MYLSVYFDQARTAVEFRVNVPKPYKSEAKIEPVESEGKVPFSYALEGDPFLLSTPALFASQASASLGEGAPSAADEGAFATVMATSMREAEGAFAKGLDGAHDTLHEKEVVMASTRKERGHLIAP